MPEMPTLGAPPKSSSSMIPGLIATAVLVGAVGGGVYAWKHRGAAETAPAVAAASDAPAGAQAATAPVNPSANEGTSPTPVIAPPTAATAPAAGSPLIAAAPTPGTEALAEGGLRSFSAKVEGPLETLVIKAVGKEVGAPLTQVVNRALVWWMKVPGDLVRGDTVSVVFEERKGQEPVVHAVRYVSQKKGKTFEAWRSKASGDAFARLYLTSGEELEERLVDAPVDNYEQVTSLLRDGRRHKGVDFKCPVGTPVRATFEATVVRKNWNFRGNGNSIELAEVGGQGRSALFLHLSELPKSLQVGMRVKKGEVVGKSGNTGHSFAPHLHYQLMKGEAVIDPFDNQATTRRRLEGVDRTRLDTEVGRLQKLIPDGTVAAR